MIVTEEEAKTKVCPEVSGPVVHDDGRSYPLLANCIGAACMAWRRHQTVIATHDPKNPCHFIEEVEISATLGYCGKAGKP